MSTFTERLNQAMVQSGVTQKDLVAVTGLTKGAISNLVTGKSKTTSVENGVRLSSALGVSVEWLIEGKGKINELSEFVKIPVYDVKASCGLGVENFDGDQPYREIQIRKDWLQTNARFSTFKNLNIITAFGDSMRPTIEDGDLLLIDAGVNELRGDAIYIARINCQIFVKRVQKMPDGTVIIKSDNRMYEPYRIAECDEFQILGKVVKRWASLNV